MEASSCCGSGGNEKKSENRPGKKKGNGWPGGPGMDGSMRGQVGENEMKEAVGAVMTAINDLLRDQ